MRSCSQAESGEPMVRDEMPVARLAQCGDLAQLGNPLGQAAIRLDDIVAAAVDEQLKLMEFPVALSAGDVDVRFGPQPGKTLVVEFPKRLLEPRSEERRVGNECV